MASSFQNLSVDEQGEQDSGVITAVVPSSPAPQATLPTNPPAPLATRSAQLPATIDPTVAAASVRSQREGLLKLIRHCLPSLANSLYAQSLIPQDVYEEVTDKNAGKAERSVALLDCVETRSEAVPSDFIKIVRILESEPYLETLASQLVHSYITLSSAPISTSLQAVSPAVSHYSSYLKSVYKSSPISPVNKWPPTPSKEYIQLAVVEGQNRCRDRYIGHILNGNVKEVLQSRRVISMEQILKPCREEDKNKRLIVIEGAPGIGKSTLAWELCRKWEEFPCMKQFNLVILLRLREKKVQKMMKVSHLFVFSTSEQESLASEVSRGHGDGVLFILDGFDELPESLQREGFIVDLINKTVLPESTVVVTSRPSATAELLTCCRPLIRNHIEVLGFTQESVKAYAASIFPDPEELGAFMNYISASKNPAINSLMYIPINAAIIVQIYSWNKSRGTFARTLSQLYTQLCLTILNKCVKLEQPSVDIQKFRDLPNDLYPQFLLLSKIAFEGIVNQQVIFYSDTIQSKLNHFGFLDEVSTLYGGGEVSYNFLHLTLQEFFAAYHISQLPDCGAALFEWCGEVEHWNVVWRFVAGMTKFHYLGSHAGSSAFFRGFHNNEVELPLFFIQCLFEANIFVDFETTFGIDTCTIQTEYATPFDNFATGYCITNCSSKGCYWNVSCRPSVEFIQGLMTRSSVDVEQGAIKGLSIIYYVDSDTMKTQSFEKCINSCITELVSPLSAITELSFHLPHTQPFISTIIPRLKSLRKVEIGGELPKDIDCLLKVLKQLLHSTVTSLTIDNPNGIVNLPAVLSAFKSLIHPSSGRLQELVMVGGSVHVRVDEFIKVVSSPSLLQHLYVWNVCLSAFDVSNSITELGIVGRQWSDQVKDVVRILKHSKVLIHMHLKYFKLDDADILEVIVLALQKNNTMRTLKLFSLPGLVPFCRNHLETMNTFLHKLDDRAEFILS